MSEVLLSTLKEACTGRPVLCHSVPAFVDFQQPLADGIHIDSWIKMLDLCLIEDAAYRKAAITALMGEPIATAFESFRHAFVTLPKIQDILLNPLNAPIPREYSLLYAACSELGRRMDKDNIEAILYYCDRIPVGEFRNLPLKMAVKRDRSLKKTAAFKSWVPSKL